MVLLKILHWLFTKVYMNIICHRFLDIIYCYKLKMIYFTKKKRNSFIDFSFRLYSYFIEYVIHIDFLYLR